MPLVRSGLGLVRMAAGLGLRLARLSRVPEALQVGPVGRLSAPSRTTAGPSVAVRSDGADLRIDPESLADAFPHASDWVAVFLPGVGESERVWRRHADQVGGSYGTRLGSLLGWTPVHLRARPETSVAESGVCLHALLQQVFESWPGGVRRVALIGHGSGGLVLRAACGVRSLSEEPWTDLVSDVVLLGTPHLAAERPVASTGLGRRLDERLAGLTSDGRAGADVEPLAHARYVVVTERTTVGRHPLGRVIGGLLWWRHTVTGRGRWAHQLFPGATTCDVSTRDFSLANHPGVQQLLLDRLA